MELSLFSRDVIALTTAVALSHNTFAALCLGGLKLLTGNLGRAIIETSAVKPEHQAVEAPAIVFNNQEELIAALDRGELRRDFAARESRLPLLPGVMTPSELIAACAAGFREMKLFPARQAGGTEMLKALAGHSRTCCSVPRAASPPRWRRSSWRCQTSPAWAALG
jgi:KDPG and KHG aldolase/Dehydratase family